MLAYLIQVNVVVTLRTSLIGPGDNYVDQHQPGPKADLQYFSQQVNCLFSTSIFICIN